MTATRVLVVEDNDRNLKLVRDVLVHAGFVVVEARSGEQGVTLAREAPPDLVLMDLGLPGMDGTEALRLLRESPPLLAYRLSPSRRTRCRQTGSEAVRPASTAT
jgi:CheY-like chemotaxis protein